MPKFCWTYLISKKIAFTVVLKDFSGMRPNPAYASCTRDIVCRKISRDVRITTILHPTEPKLFVKPYN